MALLLISFTNCSEQPQKPDQLIAEDKYINLLVELQLVRSFSETANLDSLSTDSLTQQIYEKYNVSNDIFRENHLYYQQFPKQQKERINKAIEQLKMDKVEKDTTQTVSPDSLK